LNLLLQWKKIYKLGTASLFSLGKGVFHKDEMPHAYLSFRPQRAGSSLTQLARSEATYASLSCQEQ